MKRATVIPRELPELPTLNYRDLLQEGVEALQDLAADTPWTDHNEHDPGITILQQLCYALTDLGYRTEHPIVDILEPPRGEEEPPQAFFTGDKILVGQPVTLKDYRKLLLDRIGELRNVWLEPVGPPEVEEPEEPECPNPTAGSSDPGQEARAGVREPVRESASSAEREQDYRDRYRVYFECFESPVAAQPETADGVIRAAERAEQQNRIVCQIRNILFKNRGFGIHFDLDAEQVLPIGHRHRTLGQTVLELAADADPINVVATVLFEVDLLINPYPSTRNVDAMFQQGRPPDEVYEGPGLRRGMIPDDELTTLGRTASPQQIVGALRAVEGVLEIRNASYLVLASVSGDSRDDSNGDGKDPKATRPNRFVQVLEPSKTIDGLRVLQGGGEVDLGRLKDLILDSFRHKQQQRRLSAIYAERRLQDISYTERPRGNPDRGLHRYRSIQHLFPVIYGVGPYGAPDPLIEVTDAGRIAPEQGRLERKARARQLKGYLLFFEQHLADYLVQLAKSARLLSLEDLQDRTLYSQTVARGGDDPDDPPDIAPIFGADPRANDVASEDWLGRYRERLEQLGREFDPVEQRRGLALDHLLARVNQRFPDLVPPPPEDDIDAYERAVIQRKLDYLRAFPRLSSHRGSAPPYCDDASEHERHELPCGVPDSCEPTKDPIRETLRCLTGYDRLFHVVEHRSLLEHDPKASSRSESSRPEPQMPARRFRGADGAWVVRLIRGRDVGLWPWEGLDGAREQPRRKIRVLPEYARDGMRVHARVRIEPVLQAQSTTGGRARGPGGAALYYLVDDYFSFPEAARAVLRLCTVLESGLRSIASARSHPDKSQGGGDKSPWNEAFPPCWLPDPFFAPSLSVLLETEGERHCDQESGEIGGQQMPGDLDVDKPLSLKEVVERTLRQRLPAHLGVYCLWLDCTDKRDVSLVDAALDVASEEALPRASSQADPASRPDLVAQLSDAHYRGLIKAREHEDLGWHEGPARIVDPSPDSGMGSCDSRPAEDV